MSGSNIHQNNNQDKSWNQFNASSSSSKSEKITVVVETMMGTKINVFVYKSDPIFVVKNRVYFCADIPVIRQRLVYGNEELQDHRPLSDYSIINGSVIKLLLQMRGGPITSSRRSFILDNEIVKHFLDSQSDEEVGNVPVVIVRHSDVNSILQLMSTNLSGIKKFIVYSDDDSDNDDGGDVRNERNVTINERNTNNDEMPFVKTKNTVVHHPSNFSSIATTSSSDSREDDPNTFSWAQSQYRAQKIKENATTKMKMNKLKKQLQNVSVNEQIGVKVKETNNNDVDILRLVNPSVSSRRRVNSGRKLSPLQMVVIGFSMRDYMTNSIKIDEAVSLANIASGREMSVKKHIACRYRPLRLRLRNRNSVSSYSLVSSRTDETYVATTDIPFRSLFVKTVKLYNELKILTTNWRNFAEEEDEEGEEASVSPVIEKDLERFSITESSMSTGEISVKRKYVSLSIKVDWLPPGQIPHESPFSSDKSTIDDDDNNGFATCVSNVEKLQPIRRSTSSSLLEVVNDARALITHRTNSNDQHQDHHCRKTNKCKQRCAQCNKKLLISSTYACYCNLLFCPSHRYSETHNCTYDYKLEGRKIIHNNNPLVVAEKLTRI